MEKYKLDCRYFNGYKPCLPGKVCEGCADYSPMGTRILIINLDALGDVLRTTSILEPIKRKYGQGHITWLTQRAAFPLLENNDRVDRILEYSNENTLALLTESFDVLMCVDKSRRSGSLANLIDAREKLGFGIAETGAIYPFNKEAERLYELGLNDEKKFRENRRSEQDLLCEALALEYKGDEYMLNLIPEEEDFTARYRREAGIKDDQVVIGFNSGCSTLYPYKKLAFEKQVELLKMLNKSLPHSRIVLLGGREDTENNDKLKKRLQNRVVSTPTEMGLRKGIQFINLCDIVLTGDTLGLHIALALKKNIVVWFNLTCPDEIDLYGRGHKIVSRVECTPCWRRDCANEPKCNEMVDLNGVCEATKDLCSKIEKRA